MEVGSGVTPAPVLSNRVTYSFSLSGRFMSRGKTFLVSPHLSELLRPDGVRLTRVLLGMGKTKIK